MKNDFDALIEKRDEMAPTMFKKYSDPKCRERNIWRHVQRFIANVKEDGCYEVGDNNGSQNMINQLNSINMGD